MIDNIDLSSVRSFFRIDGAWTNIEKDYIDIIFSARFMYKTYVYKTGVSARFKILGISENKFVIKLEKFNIGKLSLKWLFRIAPSVAKIFLGDDFDNMMNELLQGVGSYDQKRMTVSIDIYNLINTVDSIDSNVNVLAELITVNNLVDINIKDKINLEVNLNKIIDPSDHSKLDSSLVINSEEELQNLLVGKSISGIFGSNSEIKFNELDLNRLLSYSFQAGSEDEYLFFQEVYNDYYFYVEYPYFNIEGNKAYIIFPVKISNETSYLETIIKADITISKRTNDLIVTINQIDLHEVVISKSQINILLGQIEDEYIRGSSIVLANFFEFFEDNNLSVRSVGIDSNNLIFRLNTTTNLDILNDIKDLIDNPELVESIENIIDKYINDFDIEDIDISELEDLMDELDEETLDEIMNLIKDYYGK